jgi:hypothetical protein
VLFFVIFSPFVFLAAGFCVDGFARLQKLQKLQKNAKLQLENVMHPKIAYTHAFIQ